ncbi:hypothetical protein MMC06_006020 [Schaereria dolodes]|nr:hypothetical protein [Schaereria dolodes]
MLATPSWSVKSLIEISDDSSGTSITSKQLHHLLRLSALPLPSSEEEEAKMIQNLESQLHFVRAVQEVDTSGIEPLQCIRDETLEAEQENEINMETLKADFEKEEVVGSSRRVRKKRKDMIDTTSEEDWDALAQAPKTIGRYIVVNASKN